MYHLAGLNNALNKLHENKGPNELASSGYVYKYYVSSKTMVFLNVIMNSNTQHDIRITGRYLVLKCIYERDTVNRYLYVFTGFIRGI